MLLDDEIVGQARARVRDILSGVRDVRHSIHSEPEVGLETPKTAARIRDVLRKTSVSVWEPLIGNDVIAELKGLGQRTVCLRADIDAVPIQEQTGLPYASTVDGAMHACGHDGHTAMLLGAALVLDTLRDRLAANVRFIFQPGEELLCAGKTLVERGACDGCEAAYAIHGWPGPPLGVISAREGPQFAAGSHFTITVEGKGCHGALPGKGNNPIPAAALIVLRLQELHTQVSAKEDSLLSVCSFEAGRSSNIIPDTAEIGGTARYLNEESGDRIDEAIRRIATEVARETGARIDVTHIRSYDTPLVNTAGGYRLVKQLAEKRLAWRESERAHMTMDDFAYYLQGREGAMFTLGLGEATPELHSSTFDFSDEALEAGIMMHCLIALSYGTADEHR